MATTTAPAGLDRRCRRVRLDPVEDRSRQPGRGQGVEDRLDDPGRSHARIGHHEDARSAGRGDHLGESLDLPDPEQDPVAQRHLEAPIGERAHQLTSTTTSTLVSRRTVSQRRQP